MCVGAHASWRQTLRLGKLHDMKPLRPLAFLRRKPQDEALAGSGAVASSGTVEVATEAVGNALHSALQRTAEGLNEVLPQRSPLERVPAGAPKAAPPNVMAGGRRLPTTAFRWVGPAGRIALRSFDFVADADAVCAFQEETYSINFPEFRYTDSFAQAFRHDLRRASLDANHAAFVLDDGAVCGFLWLVICENNWTRERYGYVNNLYLAPSRRGQGLARELMTQSDSWFRSRRIHRVRLTVTTSNEEALHLYENCGYRVTRWEMEKEV
ncbi:MAG: hypothetical protein JWN98_229 [Abditibacteriota bacterium]|nr:hypothetical protein [Abditibacteriota bacterium]